ncbi:MAG: hypothetical protein E7604_07515 [Ruminococcaceae bacterium]|nr:hypothetical protein [Oscillospiraceae bacterium]
MPIPSKDNFLASLRRQPDARPTLFEPFIHKELAEQLIWRRGPQLWDTPAHYVDTMVSLRERTQADVVILDARSYCMRSLFEMLYAAETLTPSTSACVVLCRTQDQVAECMHSPVVCAIGGYEDTHPYIMPFIRMDKTAEDALSEGADGWFAPSDAETHFAQYGAALSICGGLGADTVTAMEPLAIHRRAQALFDVTHSQGYLIGSGGVIAESAYLSLISLLGIYIRCH